MTIFTPHTHTHTDRERERERERERGTRANTHAHTHTPAHTSSELTENISAVLRVQRRPPGFTRNNLGEDESAGGWSWTDGPAHS